MTYMNNKLGKYRALSLDPVLAKHMPPTKRATQETVRSMLAEYGAVYLKPSHGTGGYGICKLSRRPNGYLLQHGMNQRQFDGFEPAYRAFAAKTGSRTYLVQKAIPLLRREGRSFDLRVMVQKNRERHWEVTGIVGRLAQKGKVVTNYHNGGRPMPVGSLIGSDLPPEKRDQLVKSIEELCLRASKHMSGHFPRFTAFGVDVGLDREYRPWIIEVNSRPDKYIFNALPDKQMFRKIMRYARFQPAKRHAGS